jgi:hypothetical protein
MHPEAVRSMNKVAHDHNVYVSTGGWIENVDDAAPRTPCVTTSVPSSNSSERESINPLIGTDIKPILSCNKCLEMMQSCHHRPCAAIEKWFTIVASKPM